MRTDAPTRPGGRLVAAALLLGVFVSGLASCATPGEEASTDAPDDPLAAFDGLSGTIDVAGGSAHVPVMEAVAERVSERNPLVVVSVGAGSSALGIEKVGEGLVDIGNSSRPLTVEEDASYDLVATPFALDGVVIIVHPSNAVRDLTEDQVRDAFTGAAASWDVFGGSDSDVVLYGRQEGSGTQAVFEEAFLEDAAVHESAFEVTSNGAMVAAVANDPFGIGFIGLAFVDESVAAVAIDGVAPDVENVASGEYPYQRILHMLTRPDADELTQAFVEYVSSPAADDLVESAGYVPAD